MLANESIVHRLCASESIPSYQEFGFCRLWQKKAEGFPGPGSRRVRRKNLDECGDQKDAKCWAKEGKRGKKGKLIAK